MSMLSDQTAALANLDVSALLLPVAGELLVVPSESVADIIKPRSLQRESTAPSWMLGRMEWREASLPVLSFDALNHEREPTAQIGSRLVIMHTISDRPEAPRHYGLLTHGVPHLIRITPDDLERVDSAVLGPAERMKVKVFGQQGAIPDLDYLERNVMTVGASS